MTTPPYFSDPARAAALAEALQAREGTPFMEGIGKPGVGYDCAHLVRDAYAAAGVDVAPFDRYPQISLNYGRHHPQSRLLAFLLDVGKERLRRIAPDEPLMPGDLLGITEHQSANHLAIMENPEWFWHVPLGGCVSRVYLPPFAHYVSARLRLY